MGYVAIKGGERAIAASEELLEVLRTRGASTGEAPLELDAIAHQLHFLHGGVLSEGGLYDPRRAALAIKQSLGDPLEAAFFLRAFRSTRSRIGEAGPCDSSSMRLIRRISAAFKEIPGGQMLGPTPDYVHRLFRPELLDESPEAFGNACRAWWDDLGSRNGNGKHRAVPESFPKVVDALREQGLVPELDPNAAARPPFDITREPIVFPLPRSARLAILTRGQTGSVLALAYSNMRGYGNVHPTVAELRVGYLPVQRPHPVTGEPMEIGEVLMTECEIITGQESSDDGPPRFGLGYGACFGHNETKAISMAILDQALQRGASDGPQHPSEDPEFVLLHVDGVDSMGFCIHYKMPHYVTFQSDLDRLRTSQQKHAGTGDDDPTDHSTNGHHSAPIDTTTTSKAPS